MLLPPADLQCPCHTTTLNQMRAHMQQPHYPAITSDPEEAQRCYNAIRTLCRLTRPSALFDQEDREQLADLYEWHFLRFVRASGLPWPPQEPDGR